MTDPHPDQTNQPPGMIRLDSLPGQPLVAIEAVFPLLSQAARLEIELRATQLVATQALDDRVALETRLEMQANHIQGQSDGLNQTTLEDSLKTPDPAVVPGQLEPVED